MFFLEGTDQSFDQLFASIPIQTLKRNPFNIAEQNASGSIVFPLGDLFNYWIMVTVDHNLSGDISDVSIESDAAVGFFRDNAGAAVCAELSEN